MGLDFFAPYYRSIAQLFFGKTQLYGYRKAAELCQAGNALFVGSGDGHYLSHFSKEFSRIDFVDISKGMLHQVRENTQFNSETMRCLHQDFSEFSPDVRYDTIYMLFYLDMFSLDEKKMHVIKALSLLNEQGELVVLDFMPGGFWQRVKLFLARGLFSVLTLSTIPKVSDVESCLHQLSQVASVESLGNESVLLARVKPVAKANIL